MDELQKLYDVLVREGKYTKSFDEFKVKWGQDQAYKDKVFDVVSRDGLYTKDKNSFFQKYSGGGLTPQVPEQPIAQPIQPAQGVVEVKKKRGANPFYGSITKRTKVIFGITIGSYFLGLSKSIWTEE
jgi:hypothetical protein